MPVLALTYSNPSMFNSTCFSFQLEEFVALPNYVGLYKEILSIAHKSAIEGYTGFVAEKHQIVFRPGENTLYHGTAKSSRL